MVGKLMPVQEHFASNLIRSSLINSIDNVNHGVKKSSSRAILFCPENEYHELPLLLLHFILKQQGVKVMYMGTNTKIDTLAYSIQKFEPSIVIAFLITNFAEVDLDQYVKNLKQVSNKAKLFCGGPGFRTATQNDNKTILFNSFKQLIEALESIHFHNN
jgi:methanogenic corrinoid protein MtbC1